jgi:MinD-like ATPase involved in chromosome partitioning or flagellar assembly
VAFERRIIPISSGKGGVGKTTLAINYALELSRHGRTVLVDLDTGTSSVRACLDTPVGHDLYHFFKKGRPLADCVTPLSAKLDPRGEFRNFGFVAGPRHMIEDVSNFNQARRDELIDAINLLQANFVVLDLRAGLDANVIDFLPFTNSGILVFTPQLPAATLAASDVVKAILFRKLRSVFAEGSPVYGELQGLNAQFINALLDRVEDVYDENVHNLDAFVHDLQHALGDHPMLRAVAEAVDSFVVHYVLNMFNGVRGSYETAVKPFVQNLAENVSSHLTVVNLGWIVASERIHQANVRRVPAVLSTEAKAAPVALASDPAAQELARLATQYLGLRTPVPRKVKAAPAPGTSASRYLDGQLDTLKRMYGDLKGADYRQNFRYVVYRSLHVMQRARTGDLGDTRILKRGELPALMAARMRR